MTNKQKVSAIRAKYPKHNKMCFSIAQRTELTGVMLCPGAQSLITEDAPQPRRKDNRSFPCRLTVRLPSAVKLALDGIRHENETNQDLLFRLIWEAIEKAAASAGTENDGRHE